MPSDEGVRPVTLSQLHLPSEMALTSLAAVCMHSSKINLAEATDSPPSSNKQLHLGPHISSQEGVPMDGLERADRLNSSQSRKMGATGHYDIIIINLQVITHMWTAFGFY